MKEKNIIKQKSLDFSVRIINLYKYFIENKKEFILSKQILRSGTCVGAMVRESEHSQSKADFIHKLSIAQKENNETLYWLELFQATNYLSQEEFESINNNAIEIIKLITSIIKTTKFNINN